ncbi:U11/U12 small nuclear ribonucleoprotein 48 kDa protein-like [Branchiostoma floridae]|uniref:U11/U12 small nuclear ribonucleoprotein 48 kDa protein-like n=1 Tax=Branchiostoma floridae TaxID=7739 RepID=A0A9J7KMK6_BRAFL|nr:U11/U12 small nuclear ribonucleoprotein 48 kDa protein-like [Branchiostoma floridae]
MHKSERHESREEQLEELSCYLNSSRGKLSGVLKRFGWTNDKISYTDMVVCPLDSAHCVPPSRLTEHVKDCRLAKAGYDAEEREKMKESCHFYYTNSQSVVPVTVDRDIQEKVISQCASSTSTWAGTLADGEQGRLTNSQMRSFTQAVSSAPAEERRLPLKDEELTTAQRLAMHNYVVQQARDTSNRPAFSTEDSTLTADLAETVQKQEGEGKGPKSHLEILAELRDYKRRRQSYRAKNVHITKRSATEVMRQVIETQMEMLEQMNRGSNDNEKNSSDTDNRSGERTHSPAVRMDSPRQRDSPRQHHRHRSSHEDHHRHREQRHSKHKKSRERSHSPSPNRRKKHRH